MINLNIGTKEATDLLIKENGYIVDHQFYNHHEVWFDEDGVELKEPDYSFVTAEEMDTLDISFYSKSKNLFIFEDKIIDTIKIENLRRKDGPNALVKVRLEGEEKDREASLNKESIDFINKYFELLSCKFKLNYDLTCSNL